MAFKRSWVRLPSAPFHHSLNVDPQLTKSFELALTSPLIKAGTCAGARPTDVEGDPRPSGAGCDIGADEFEF
jgi:hypothetical protein